MPPTSPPSVNRSLLQSRSGVDSLAPTTPLWLITLALVVTYVATGKLSLWLAIPPGYASAIFPPAGIALAATYISGKRALPGVFLGSLILNLWVGLSAGGHPDLVGIYAAVLIAGASMLQAAIGGWGLGKAIGYPNAFDDVRDVFYFQFLTPLICLVSATLSVSGLCALGIIQLSNFAASWMVWGIGDILGVLVALPLTLIIAGKPRPLWRKRASRVAIPMALALALLVVFYVQVSKWEQAETLLEFCTQSQRLADLIQARLDEQEEMLEQLGEVISNEDGVPPEAFQLFAQKALQRFPMIQAIEWAPRVAALQRQAFETAQHSRFPGFQILEYANDGKMRPAGKRPQFYPVTYLEPLSGNEAAIGFDLSSSPARHAALEKTVRHGNVVATEPLRLVQERGQQNGILIMLGVNIRSGRAGVVLTVIKVNDFLFLNKLLPANNPVLRARLVDINAKQMMYNSFLIANQQPQLKQTLRFGGRLYLLETTPSLSYLSQHRGWQSWAVLAIGTLGVGLLGALLLVGTGHTARVEQLVQKRTAELKESETRIREIAAALGEGVYVLDEHGRIGFTNPEAQRMLGWSESEMLGSKAHALFHYMRTDGSHLPDAACPMLSVLQTGQTYRGEEVFWRHDRSALPVEVCASPIIRDGKNVGAVVAFSDISERKTLEAKLYRQAFFDPLTNLANRRYFLDRLQQALHRARRNQKGGAVLFMDMDGFKQINDSYGHEAGDKILQTFAQRLVASVRKVDTVARLGGDEFTILLEGLEEPRSNATAVAQKVFENLAEPVTVASHSIFMATSIGIAVFDPHTDATPDSVLSQADMAMYQAKKGGKNRLTHC